MAEQAFMRDAFSKELDLSIEAPGDSSVMTYRHVSQERKQEYDTSIQDAYTLPPINVDVAMMPITEDIKNLNYNDLVDLNVVNMDDNSEPNTARQDAGAKSPESVYDEAIPTTPLCFLKLFPTESIQSDFELLPSYKFQELTDERINNLVRVTLSDVESSGQLTQSSTASVASLSRRNAVHYKHRISESRSWEDENTPPVSPPTDYDVLVNPTLSKNVMFSSLSPVTRARSLPGEVISDKPGLSKGPETLNSRSRWHRFWLFKHCSGTPRGSTADSSTE